MSPDQVFTITVVAIGAWTVARVLRGPLGEALARRIAGTVATPQRAEEVDELRARMVELEERVDFTERMLLQEDRAEGRLPRGGAR